MNRINITDITVYEYRQTHITIDGIALPNILNNLTPNTLETSYFYGLHSAFSKELFFEHEIDIIRKLSVQKSKTIVPILLCPDDLDLSCIVIVAEIEKDESKVYWNKIGQLCHEKYNRILEGESGILHLESYTDEDFKLYGDNIALAKYNDQEYIDWVNENFKEEYSRRFTNYILPFYQNEENFDWLFDVNWSFDINDYYKCISILQAN